jgi:hypothetical protein
LARLEAVPFHGAADICMLQRFFVWSSVTVSEATARTIAGRTALPAIGGDWAENELVGARNNGCARRTAEGGRPYTSVLRAQSAFDCACNAVGKRVHRFF